MGTEDTEDTAFGRLLRRHRQRAGLTQEALAARARLSVEAISALERGSRRAPRRYTVALLADALRLDAQQRAEFTGAAGPVKRARPQPRTAGPRQLPPASADFTGRAEVVDELVALLGPAGRTAVTIAAIAGMGGIGKTALAVQVAHLVSAEFPDGQLYLDLRGHGTARATTALEALGAMMRALGVPVEEIPKGVDEAACRYRSALAGRRVLVVLDNAADEAQVQALLPGTAGCAALVTSRRSMASLPGVHHLQLDVLSDAAGLELLRSIGGSRVDDEPGAAADVLHACGNLPLAIRIAGARLAVRPGWPVSHLARRLLDEGRRLGELRSGDVAVRSTFEVSLEHLLSSELAADRRAADAFARLALPDGADVSITVAARLLDSTEADTADRLDRLVELNLLDEPAPGRYRLHDLLRVYAREVAARLVPAGEQQRALVRVISLYAAVLWRTRGLSRPRLGTAWEDELAGYCPDGWDPGGCLAWLDEERQHLVPIARQAVALPGEARARAVQLALGCITFYATRRHFADWIQILRAALDANGDRVLAGWLHDDLGLAYSGDGRDDDAVRELHRGLAAFRAVDDRAGEASCCNGMTLALGRLGRVGEAIEAGERGLGISRALGDRRGVARASLNLGLLYWQAGQRWRGLAHEDRSRGLYEELRIGRGVGMALVNLGAMHRAGGSYELARRQLSRSLRVFQAVDDPAGQAEALEELGQLHASLGDYREALAELEDGLARATEYGDRYREASIRRRLGNTLAALGCHAEAGAHWREALQVYELRGDAATSDELRTLLATTRAG